jgi:DNA-binding transcriptional regulator YhcF (GntR family)
MIEPIDERGNLAGQLAHYVCAQICRAAYRAGDLLETPGDVAERLLINPRRVREAYERLRDDGIVACDSTDAYVVTDDALTKARRLLTELAQVQLTQTLAVLEGLGTDEAAIDDMIARARSKLNVQTATDGGDDE